MFRVVSISLAVLLAVSTNAFADQGATYSAEIRCNRGSEVQEVSAELVEVPSMPGYLAASSASDAIIELEGVRVLVSLLTKPSGDNMGVYWARFSQSQGQSHTFTAVDSPLSTSTYQHSIRSWAGTNRA